MENLVKIGIIGVGNMGSSHATNIIDGKVKNLKLIAICDIDEKKRTWAKETLGEDIKIYDNYKDMIDSGEINAVIVATPHYFHPEMAIYAFSKGLNVISEKPAGVYTKQVEEMNEAAAKAGTVFSMMYNQRTNPLYAKLKDLVESGQLGSLKRMVWIITNWYRSQAYYDSGTWRATWSGEGGGVLINQCPHNLDLWQWIFGMPSKVRGFCTEGKYHDIEVEDDVTAYAEYENGATAVFITTTGECPGTNRLEVSGDRGKAVIEGNTLTFYELETPEREFCFATKGGFGTPAITTYDIKTSKVETAHIGIMQNFTNAILEGEKLIAPGVEGIRGLTISNAIHLSSWTNDTVTLPIDKELYLKMLNEKIKTSRRKPEIESVAANLEGTYSK